MQQLERWDYATPNRRHLVWHIDIYNPDAIYAWVNFVNFVIFVFVKWVGPWLASLLTLTVRPLAR